MLPTCLLVSGELGLKVLEQIHQSAYDLKAVFTDKSSGAIINYCEKHQIPYFTGNPRKGRAAAFINTIECDVLFSVNYLFIIEKDLIQLPKKYPVNIHGSLLPKYRGRSPHVWAIINGEKITGITVHIIDEKVDNGDIIKQILVTIDDNDTGGSILKKFNLLYPSLVKTVLNEIANNKINLQKQDTSLATYFGKRTPKSGRINWNWSKERIRNWIRAQARPYPGAFSFYKKQKVVIHHASYSDFGFHYKDINGMILKVEENNLTVKTSNGALTLSDFEFVKPINFLKGDILS